MLYILLKLFLIFVIGSIAGWILELIYRRFFGKAKAWINPGFLSGPYLPIYGFSCCLLYLVSSLDIDILYKIIIGGILITIFELCAGIFFTKYYNVRLWDYRNHKFNIKGQVCPRYTFYWCILVFIFIALLYDPLYNNVIYLYNNLEYGFILGIIYGIAIVDISHSLNAIERIKKSIKDMEFDKTISFDGFKKSLKEHFGKTHTNKFSRFIFPLKGKSIITDKELPEMVTKAYKRSLNLKNIFHIHDTVNKDNNSNNNK